MTAKPENTRAIRTRAVVELGEDYQMFRATRHSIETTFR